MNRTGLIVTLVIAAGAGALFGVFPQLDLRIAGYFHAFVDTGKNYFALRIYPPMMLARDLGLWVGTILVAPAVLALLVKLLLPARKMLIPGRAALFLIATMALGPGLLVNVVLKDHWGRPRPIDVREFGGTEQFEPWWKPGGDCTGNCSFVSGDVAGAFWTIAPAALAPPPFRLAAYGAALALGTAMGAFRVMAGGHFMSDVIFAGVFAFLVIWLCYALIYRWPRTRITDDDVERALERIAVPGHDFVAGLFRKKKTEL